MIHLLFPRLCDCGIVHKQAVPTAHDLRPYDNLFLVAAAKNAGLNAITALAPFGSLHTAFSITGANEIAGGSPAYARQALTWSAASAGSAALAATLPTWPVPAGGVVAWIGFWSLATAGTFQGMLPAGGGSIQTCDMLVADITSNTINAKSHGLSPNNNVIFWGSVPTGITVGTVYFVSATATADIFSISLTSGGAVIDITGTAPFNFYVQKAVTENFAGQGTYAVASLSIDPSVVI